MNNLAKKEKKAVRELIAELKKMYEDNLSRIILYGSKARGDVTKSSDIDIMIVLNNYKRWDKEFDKVHGILHKIDKKYDYDLLISTVIKKRSDVLFQNSPLLLNVRKEGIDLWIR
ncbi:MAG: nucleotidyltransferase domain-containing protein [Elusimicrobia bacterium]|nr:nucleotidyltransferase domain-containing protein [Elusimicrobiota bacterium]